MGRCFEQRGVEVASVGVRAQKQCQCQTWYWSSSPASVHGTQQRTQFLSLPGAYAFTTCPCCVLQKPTHLAKLARGGSQPKTVLGVERLVHFNEQPCPRDLVVVRGERNHERIRCGPRRAPRRLRCIDCLLAVLCCANLHNHAASAALPHRGQGAIRVLRGGSVAGHNTHACSTAAPSMSAAPWTAGSCTANQGRWPSGMHQSGRRAARQRVWG